MADFSVDNQSANFNTRPWLLVALENDDRHTDRQDSFFIRIDISIIIKHESCLCVCLSVRIFRSHKKSQHHEILAQGVISTGFIFMDFMGNFCFF